MNDRLGCGSAVVLLTLAFGLVVGGADLAVAGDSGIGTTLFVAGIASFFVAAGLALRWDSRRRRRS